MKESLHAANQLDLSSHFARTPACDWQAPSIASTAPASTMDVKNVFTFLKNFGHVFYVFDVFYFPNVFLFLKKRWQSSERQAD